MPGPISDAYDGEWGTACNADRIDHELEQVYLLVTKILGGKPPMPVLELVSANLAWEIQASLAEKQWRLLRFATRCGVAMLLNRCDACGTPIPEILSTAFPNTAREGYFCLPCWSRLNYRPGPTTLHPDAVKKISLPSEEDEAEPHIVFERKSSS